MTNIRSSDETALRQGWFLQVISGPLAGNKRYLEPGQVANFGRRPDVALACPDDRHISGVHFAVQCRESRYWIKDLNSRNGTFVNGARVQEAVLTRHDLITAGETTFAFAFEEAATTLDVSTSQPPIAGPDEELLNLLRNNYQPLFAVLDSARDQYALALLLQSQAQYQSLYEGPRSESLSHVAPYLVRLPADASLLSMLVKNGWGKSWGIYLKCSCEFQELRRHLRHFLQVRHPDGEQLYFRFYDPRVLRLYLPTLTQTEAGSFCGPVSCYLMEDENPGQLLQFVNTGHGIGKSAIALVSPVGLATLQLQEDRR